MSGKVGSPTKVKSSASKEEVTDDSLGITMIGGEKVPTFKTPQATTSTVTKVMYTKEKRQELSEEKRIELFEKATKATFVQKFDVVSLSVTDENKLDDIRNIGTLVGKFRDHLVKYDMINVFTVLDLDEAQKLPIQENDLMQSHATLKESTVAKSNQWYNEWTIDPYYRENLQLSYDFLANNTTEKLLEKCLETYEEFPSSQQGGPLLFIIMMKKLQSDTEAAVEFIQTTVKNMKLTLFDGEDVNRAITLIRAAHKRLKGVGGDSSKVPLDFPRTLMDVFQTSSVPNFNEIFAHLSRTAMIQAQYQGTPFKMTMDQILKLAETRYLEMLATGEWTGATTKASSSVFFVKGTPPTGPKEVVCWNCGESGHAIKDCPKGRNEAQIQRRREEFFESKTQGGRGRGRGRGGGR